MEIDKKLGKILKKVEKPARYIGGEINSIAKDINNVKTRFAFAFPDMYEIGMSYMGMQILYNILNKNENIYCERVFAPAHDMETEMRNEGIELFTLETHTPVKEMDMLGFTLQYELSYTNVINMLNLAGIPICSRDRGNDMPIVIAGGPCAFNPEPLADFIDVFLIGDGEELLEQVCLIKGQGMNRKDFLEKICELNGVYIPEFYDVQYNEDGRISHVLSLNDKAPIKVKRAIIKKLETTVFPTENIVPFIETVHDRSVIETFRGCTRGCRFCQAGMIYRPVRERKKDTIKKLAEEQLINTGHEELSLLSLSTSDYSAFEPLALELMEMCRSRNVALSLPSLRLDSFSFNVLNEIQKYRKSGLTFAPEAGTQRLRDVINKNITEEDIYTSVEKAIDLGWENIKLYFMIGLPSETYSDLDGIAEIAKKIMDINYRVRGKKGGRFRLTVSVSNFIPKPHTPFQWCRQNTPEEFIEKHNYLSGILRIKGVIFNYHETDTSNLEGIFARGDRRLGRLLRAAVENGCKFDGWTEFFKDDMWEKAIEDTDTDVAFYNFRERAYDEILPWNVVDPMIRTEFLQSEREKSKSEETTRDCRKGCVRCGINKYATCFDGAEFDNKIQ